MSFVALAALLLFVAEQRKRLDCAEEVPECGFSPCVSSTLELKFSTQAVERLKSEGEITQRVKQFRQEYFEQFGVLIPEVLYDVDRNIPGLQLRVLLHGQESLCLEMKEDEQCSAQVVASLKHFLEENIAQLVNDTQTRMLQEVYQPVAEDLWNSLIPNSISVTELTSVFRQLILEGLSIREYPKILQAVAEAKFTPKKRRPCRFRKRVCESAFSSSRIACKNYYQVVGERRRGDSCSHFKCTFNREATAVRSQSG